MPTYLTAILPLVGVLIGAGLHYVFGRTLERSKQLTLEKGKAYADYFRSFSQAAKVGSTKEVLSATIDAKTRICLYGSLEVIKKLAEFERGGAKALDNEAKVTALLRAMRKDMSAAGATPEEDDLSYIVFGRATSR